MISKITESINEFFQTADGEVALHKYQEMQKTEGFKIYQMFLAQIANGLLNYMVTKQFTELDGKQKDIEQRAIYECKELIEFLINPVKGYRRQLAAHNQRMAQTVKGRR